MKNNNVLKWVIGFSSVAMFTGFIGMTQKVNGSSASGQQVASNNSIQQEQGEQGSNTDQNPYAQENPSWGDGYQNGEMGQSQGRGYHHQDSNSQAGWGGDFDNSSNQSQFGSNGSNSTQEQFGNSSVDENRVSGRAS